MSPRTGRPTKNPKTEEIKIRATKEDKDLLKECCDLLNQTQYDVVMNGIKKVHAEIKKQSSRYPTKIPDYSTEKFPSVNIVMQIETSFNTNFERSFLQWITIY